MPDKQARQNTLPAATIQRHKGEMSVDVHFALLGSQKNLTLLLRVLMNIRKYENNLWTSDHADYFCILWSFYETKLALGLEESLDSIETLQIKMFHKYLYKNEMWIHNEKIIPATRFNMTPNAYYGLFPEDKKITFEFPIVKERRRKSINHHTSFIGVGYRDKGAARNVSQSGVQSWGETVSGINMYRQEAITLRRNISLIVKDPTIKTVTLQDSRKLAGKPIKANFQLVQSGEHLVGYKLRVEPLGKRLGFIDFIEEEWVSTVNSVLKTRITDGEVFFF